METRHHGAKRGLLLIGFNRPSLFRDRLEALNSLANQDIKIFISIDGPREDNPNDFKARDRIRREIEKSALSQKAEIWISEKNKGCDLHIFQSISQALLSCDYLAVIEDDIEIPANVVLEMLNVAESLPSHLNLSPVIAMSGLSRRIPFTENHWRESHYFSAWGFVIPRKFWEIHTCRVEKNETFQDSLRLEDNWFWMKMSPRKKFIWSERMTRKNYDYAIQKTLFTYEIPTIAPTNRLINNVGHGIAGASHTRFKTPWYLRRNVHDLDKRHGISQPTTPKKINWLIWLDSQTWAGDGLLSVRGRTVGIRSTIRQLFRKFIKS